MTPWPDPRPTDPETGDPDLLILFDIDGTLLRSGGAGPRSMALAMRELHPPRHPGDEVDHERLDTAGWLDPLIWRAMLDQIGREADDGGHEAFRRTYGEILARIIEEERPVYALEGAGAAARWVHEHPTLESALLTGNYPETGRLKIEAAGLDPDHFRFGAWGSEATLRRGLPPLAIRRAAEELGLDVEPHQTVIVGDTPADIDCAHHNGCRVIAVATGRFTEDQLRPHGADVLLPDLRDLARFREAVETTLAAGPRPMRD